LIPDAADDDAEATLIALFLIKSNAIVKKLRGLNK
jgi:hypothetical protein